VFIPSNHTFENIAWFYFICYPGFQYSDVVKNLDSSDIHNLGCFPNIQSAIFNLSFL